MVMDAVPNIVQIGEMVKLRSQETNQHAWYYCETSSWPMTGIEIHWHPIDLMRCVHRGIDSRDTGIPEDSDDLGYNRFQCDGYPYPAPLLTVSPTSMLKGNWTELFKASINFIYGVIRQCHGITFLLNPNVDDAMPIRALHICDFISIIHSQACNYPTPSLALDSTITISDLNKAVTTTDHVIGDSSD